MTPTANGSVNGYSSLSPAARKALTNIGSTGSPFDPLGSRLFLDYQDGTVFDAGEWDARKMRQCLSVDGKARSLEQVLALPIRAAQASIQPAKGDNGEASFCQDVLSDKLDDLIDQMTSAIAYRRSFHEKMWSLNDGKLVIDELAWRPAQTCDARWRDDGTPDGFRQRVAWGLDRAAQSNTNRTPGWVSIPRERAFVYVHGRHREPLTGVSDLEVVWRNWETRQKVFFLLCQFLEGQALPKMVAYGQGIEDAENNADAIAAAKASGVIPMSYPNGDFGKTFDVIESSGRGSQQFLDAIHYLESTATNSVLAGFTELATAANNGNGSYALSQDQSEFFAQSRQAVANEIANSIRRDLLTPLCLYNFGADAAIPTVTLGPISNREQERAIGLLQTLLVSPVVQAPRGFLEQLLGLTAQFVGIDAEKLHDELDKTRGTPDAYVSIAEIRDSSKLGPDGQPLPVPAPHGTPAAPQSGPAGQQIPLPGMPATPPATTAAQRQPESPDAALHRAVTLSHELVTRALSGEDPQDALKAMSGSRGRRRRK